MGTNYYGRKIPTLKRREEIKNAVDNNDFDEIKNLVHDTYALSHYSYDTNTIVGGEIHLGKRSGGWKFLWNPNWYKTIEGHTEVEKIDEHCNRYHFVVDDEFKAIKIYDLTKKSIKEFIDREDIEIYDEYGEKQDKEEFWKMAIEWCAEDGWDGETYEEWEENRNPYRRTYNYETDYCKFLEHHGFVLNKYKTDFYSDGLRFATCTEFS